MGCKRADVKAVSNVTEVGSPSESKEMAWAAASESSGCIRMNDIPVFDQSVVIKVGRVLS